MAFILSPRSFPLIVLSMATMVGCVQMTDTRPETNVSTPVVFAEAPEWAPKQEDLSALLNAFDVPGLSMVSLNGCQPSRPVNAGFARLAPNSPVNDNTVFEAASLSKPVFAFLVVALAEDGVIDLDQSIAADFAYARISDKARFRLLTPRMILAHQTGLPNWVGDTDNPNRDDPINFESYPGEKFSYSGEAYELLRAYVETKTGKTLNTIFRERLGSVMPQSTFALPVVPGTVAAKGYANTRNPASGRELENLRESANAAGGLVTTAHDYSRFLSLVCNRQGLSANAYDEMLTPLTPTPPGEFPAPASYGLGWAIMQMGPQTFILHGGNNDEFRSLAAIFPQTNEGMVILTNGRNGGDLIDAMIEQMQ